MWCRWFDESFSRCDESVRGRREGEKVSLARACGLFGMLTAAPGRPNLGKPAPGHVPRPGTGALLFCCCSLACTHSPPENTTCRSIGARTLTLTSIVLHFSHPVASSNLACASLQNKLHPKHPLTPDCPRRPTAVSGQHALVTRPPLPPPHAQLLSAARLRFLTVAASILSRISFSSAMASCS